MLIRRIGGFLPEKRVSQKGQTYFGWLTLLLENGSKKGPPLWNQAWEGPNFSLGTSVGLFVNHWGTFSSPKKGSTGGLMGGDKFLGGGPPPLCVLRGWDKKGAPIWGFSPPLLLC